MATSGSIDFTVDRDSIIKESLELLGVLGEGESPSAAQLSSSSITLNMMVKAWQADGLNLFAIQRGYLFLEKSINEYTLSASTSNHWTSTFIETTVAVAAAITDTTVELTSVVGVSSGDNIGIATGTDVHWTTINGAPAGNVVTLTDAMPAASGIGSVVYSYTSKANRPMAISSGYVHINGGADIPLTNVSRSEYYSLANKTSDGLVNQFYYDPQVKTPSVFVWPQSSDETNYIIFIAQRTLEDFDAATDTADFPQEWYLPLSYGLAVLLSPKYGLDPSSHLKLNRIATEWYEKAQGFDQEAYTSLFFRPEYD